MIDKLKFDLASPTTGSSDMLDYLRRTPGVRDVVVSGGDVANMPWPRLEAFVAAAARDREHPRHPAGHQGADGAAAALAAADEVRAGMERLGTIARERGVSIAIHTHVNHAKSVTPLVAEATRAMLDTGIRDVRNQGVLLRGVNDRPDALLDLCFALLDGARIMPYYFYMCDMIPFSEHWRVSVARGPAAAARDHGLPARASRRRGSSATCRSSASAGCTRSPGYDTERGISYWTKNYRTAIEADDPDALRRSYEYYDPIHTLPAEGQEWWADFAVRAESGLASLSTGLIPAAR